jgi:phage major head subunit gpT-like protein
MIPHISGAFGDLLDPRFQKIFHEQYNQLPDMLGELFMMVPHNGRDIMTWSEVGAFADWTQFSGHVNYDSLYQGYDTTATYLEFASGFQVERKLFDDDQFNIMDRRPAGLATAAMRTRQGHGARVFNNAFSNDTYFQVRSEGVALCSNSHTTTAAGVSTAQGFDNLGTSALSATAVAAARIAFTQFRDDRGNFISCAPDELLYPPNLYEEAEEIVSAVGKLDVANNNPNVHKGRFTLKEWVYLTDTNNWFLMDSTMRKQSLYWIDRVEKEFAYAEDLDTIIAKWRGYMRYAQAFIDWRWVYGHQVS